MKFSFLGVVWGVMVGIGVWVFEDGRSDVGEGLSYISGDIGV